MNSYYIDGQSVSQKDFDVFLKSLKGQYNWSCDKTTDGGVTMYQARDKAGHMFNVSLETGGQNRQTIDKVKN